MFIKNITYLLFTLLILLHSVNGALAQDERIERTSIPPHGLLYQPKNPSRSPILLVHGGGFLVGAPDTTRFDLLSRRLAANGHLVLSLQYPLLWQGLTREKGVKAFHCAAQRLAPHDPISVVAVSAGAWLAARALQLAPARGDCKNHGPITRFAGLSAMISPEKNLAPRIIASLFERTFAIPPLARSDLPEKLFLLQGHDDWLVPEPASRGFCNEFSPQKNCNRTVIPGGHFLVRGGQAGTEATTQELLQFLKD